MSTPSDVPRVAIHYHRPPNRLRVYDQRVVLERSDVIVTLSEPIRMDEPMTVGGDVALEDGSLALWFTFPGLWHDIGRFHRADGRYAGLYANVLTPVEIEDRVWRTTDLYLDVWWPQEGEVSVLDEHELADALARGHLDPETAGRARAEAAAILSRAAAGAWPPAVVHEWTLARALEALGESG